MADLILAIWILSNPVSEDLTIGHLELNAPGKAWVNRIRKQIDMPRDCALVTAYIADYYAPPEIMSDKEANPLNNLGAPWIFSLVIGVVRHLHLPLREVWTMGMGQLLWYRAALMELDDPTKRIIDDTLRAEMKKAREPQVLYKMEPGETIEVFAARVGLDPTTAAMLLHQGGR